MIQITKADNQDIEGLAVLFNQLSQKQADFDAMKRRLNEISKDTAYSFLVARDEQDRTVGMAMGIVCNDLAGTCQPFMLIENVAVLESCQNHGIGKKLMAALESVAREKDCQYIILVSGNERTPAHSFYQSIGYEMRKGFKKRL